MYFAIYGLNPRTDDDGIVINPCKYVFDVASTRKTDTRYVRAQKLFSLGRVRISDSSNVNAAKCEQHFQHLSLVGNRYL